MYSVKEIRGRVVGMLAAKPDATLLQALALLHVMEGRYDYSTQLTFACPGEAILSTSYTESPLLHSLTPLLPCQL